MSLTDDDRQLLERAREIGPSLRAGSGDRDRLAGWLLAELVALAEHLAGQLAGPAEAKAPPDSMCEDCPHGRTAHLTRAPSRTEPYFCSACECRQYRGPNDLERLAATDADVTERRRQWRASLRGDAG